MEIETLSHLFESVYTWGDGKKRTYKTVVISLALNLIFRAEISTHNAEIHMQLFLCNNAYRYGKAT